MKTNGRTFAATGPTVGQSRSGRTLAPSGPTEDPETAMIREMIKEVPTPCSNCGGIAYVTAEERSRGKWNCYSCGTINHWRRPKKCVKCESVIADPKLAANEDERCAGCGDPDEFGS